MSPIQININLKAYLISFLEGYYETKQPFKFPNSDDFNKLLTFLVEKPPTTWKEKNYGVNNFCVVLPYNSQKNVLYNFYVSERRQKIFEKKVHDFFFMHFHSDMNEMFNLKININDAIELFQEKYLMSHHEIFEMLKKDYYRYRNRKNVEKFRNKRHSNVVDYNFSNFSNTNNYS